jgi:hypothetical protein
VLQMVRKDVNQFELLRFFTPDLAEMCPAGSAFFGRTINSVEDRHASKICMTN